MKAGWRTRTLAEVCTKVTDGSHFSPSTVASGYPYITVRDIKESQIDFECCAFVERAAFLELQRNGCSPSVGDVLFSKDGTVGKVALVESETDFVVLSSLAILRPNTTLINPKYLSYVLRSPAFLEEAIGKKTGVAIRRIILKNLKQIPVPYPSIPEQQRIVTLLDEAFDGITTAKANAEKNLQNARAIFESHLQSVFDDAAEIGESVVLADLASDITDGDHMPPPKALQGVPFITIGNIAKDARTIDFSDTFMVSKAYFDGLKANKKPQLGDVLYTVTGSYGVPVLINESREFCFQRHIGLVRPKPGVSSEWLYYLLMSPQVFKQANEGATGTAQKTVSLKVLRGYKVPKVPLAMQLTTVAKLDSLFEETQRLESLYQRKLTALDELKKSLLAQAFSGAL